MKSSQQRFCQKIRVISVLNWIIFAFYILVKLDYFKYKVLYDLIGFTTEVYIISWWVLIFDFLLKIFIWALVFWCFSGHWSFSTVISLRVVAREYCVWWCIDIFRPHLDFSCYSRYFLWEPQLRLRIIKMIFKIFVFWSSRDCSLFLHAKWRMK